VATDVNKVSFEHHLLRAMFSGDHAEDGGPHGLSDETWEALGAVAREYPNVTDESVRLAREAFQREAR
jgi:hypothetical protein